MSVSRTRRQFLTGLIASGVALRVGEARGNAAGQRPNIIVMLADDLGYGDLGCYGCPDIKTPHLDALAREGVRFTDAYASAPVCSPTRVAFITGQYQQRLGEGFEDYMGAGSPGVDPAVHPSMARFLKDAGYRTACYGKWNIGGAADTPANAYGFDHWAGIHHNCNYFTHLGYDFRDMDWTGPNRLLEDGEPLDKEGYITRILGDYAVDYIAKAGERPFFLFLPWQAPHSPMQGPDEDPQRPHVPKDITPDMRSTYVKIVEEMDRQTGRIMTMLRDRGLDANTLVMFTSDNGGHGAARNTPFKGMKQDLFEGGIRVPLILWWPGRVPAGGVDHRPAITMDLTATALAVAGVIVRSQDGVNLLDPPEQDRVLYWRRRTINHPAKTNVVRARAIRAGKWKYHEDVLRGGVHLHDLEADPEERVNLAEAQPERAAALKKRLAQWERDVADRPPLYGETQ